MHEGIAQLIGTVDGLVYSDAAESNVFVDRLPSTPDRAVCVYSQPAGEPDARLPYDPVEFQVIVRGEQDGVWALATWRAIYSKLHGLRNRLLPDGTYAVFVLATSGSPVNTGDDSNGRPQFSGDYRGEILNHTEARP